MLPIREENIWIMGPYVQYPGWQRYFPISMKANMYLQNDRIVGIVITGPIVHLPDQV
jgi:hypothetical protein